MRLIDDQREMMNVFLSRILTLPDGEEVCGDEVWQEYEELLHDKEMDYSEQRVKLHDVKCRMNMFVYQVEKGSTFPGMSTNRLEICILSEMERHILKMTF